MAKEQDQHAALVNGPNYAHAPDDIAAPKSPDQETWDRKHRDAAGPADKDNTDQVRALLAERSGYEVRASRGEDTQGRIAMVNEQLALLGYHDDAEKGEGKEPETKTKESAAEQRAAAGGEKTAAPKGRSGPAGRQQNA